MDGPNHEDVVRQLHTLQGQVRRAPQHPSQWLSVRDGDVEITLEPLPSRPSRKSSARAGAVTDVRLAALHLRLDALDTRLSSLLTRADGTAATTAL